MEKNIYFRSNFRNLIEAARHRYKIASHLRIKLLKNGASLTQCEAVQTGRDTELPLPFNFKL